MIGDITVRPGFSCSVTVWMLAATILLQSYLDRLRLEAAPATEP